MGTRAGWPGSGTGWPDDAVRAEAAQAVTAVYEAHAVGLIRLAVIMLGDRAAAEDVVQEAFCGLYRRWGQLADPDKALSYVRAATLNGCRSELRHRIRAQRRGGPAPGRGRRRLGGAGRAARRGTPAGPQRAAAAAGPAAGGLSAPVLPRPDRAGDRGGHGHQPRHGQVHHVPRAGRAGPAYPGGGPMISPVMSTEERLRAATRAAADTVAPGSAPPLQLPDDPAAGPHARWRGRARRWLRALTPLAAAAAVAAAVIVSLALTSGVPHVNGWRAEPARPEALSSVPGRTTWRSASRRPRRQRAVIRATGDREGPAPPSRPPRPYRGFTFVSGAARRPHVRPGRPAVVGYHVRHGRAGRAAPGQHHAGRVLPAAVRPGHPHVPSSPGCPIVAGPQAAQLSRHRAVPGRHPARPRPALSGDRGRHAGHRIGTVLGLARRWPVPPAPGSATTNPIGAAAFLDR